MLCADAQLDRALFAPQAEGKFRPYEIRNIVDRVGGGDAFAAGLLFAMDHADYAELDAALRFAAAASCLAHSIVGDINYSSLEEIKVLMSGSTTGRVVR